MAGRRANGEGTAYQRKDGRWEAAGYVATASGGSTTRSPPTPLPGGDHPFPVPATAGCVCLCCRQRCRQTPPHHHTHKSTARRTTRSTACAKFRKPPYRRNASTPTM